MFFSINNRSSNSFYLPSKLHRKDLPFCRERRSTSALRWTSQRLLKKRFYLHHLMRVELQWPSIPQLLLQMFHQPYLDFRQRQLPWCITFEYSRRSKTASTWWLLNGELGEWVRDGVFLHYQGFERFYLPCCTSSPLRWPCRLWGCFLVIYQYS